MSLANLWVLPMLLMGLVLVATAARAHRSRSFVHEHVLAALAGAAYTLPYAAEMASTSLAAKMVFHRLAWFGIASLPAAALLLALRFAGRPLGRRGTQIVWLVAAAFVLLSCTNELHFWLETPARLVDYGSFAMRSQEGAWAFWLFTALAYGCVLATLICYAAVWLTGSVVYRRQGRVLFLGTLIPIVGNVVYLFLGGTRIRELDPTPLLYGVTCLVYAYSLRSGLLQIIPVARHVMFDEMDLAVFVLDSQDRVIDANGAARTLLGLHGSHDPTIRLERFLATAPALAALLPTRALGELGDVPVGERTFAVRATSLSAGAGRLVFLRDVTERARSEEAQRRAQRARAEFIARMSHELRTPLHGVIGATEMLLASLEQTDARRKFAESSLLSAQVLLELVDDVLDFERLERDALQPSKRPFDLRELVRGVAAAQGPAASRKGLTVETTLPDAAVWVQGDGRRVRQIVTNLVGNGIKFTERGALHLQLSIRAEAGAIPFSLVIDDDGPGIPEHELARVFEPFVQLDDGATRHHGGAGLGLSISRHLAEALGLQIELRAREHGGLRALVSGTLPAAEAEAPTSPAPLQLPPLRVFVVDDNPVSRDVIRWLLELVGVEAEIFATGAALIAAVQVERPDIALIDLHMPGGGGREVARALRAAGHDSLPLVAFTADGRDQVRSECLAAGMDDLLQKPCTVAELRACLHRNTREWSAPTRDLGAADKTRELEVRALFLRTVPGEWTRLAEAFAHGNREEVRRLAHEMAGAAALTGFLPVVEACRALLEAEEFAPSHVDAVRAACMVLAHEGALDAIA